MILKRNQSWKFKTKRELANFLNLHDLTPKTARINLDSVNQLWRVLMIDGLPSKDKINEICLNLVNKNFPIGNGSGRWINYLSNDGEKIIKLGDWTNDHSKLNPIDTPNEIRWAFRNLNKKNVEFIGVFKLAKFYQYSSYPRIGYVEWKLIEKETYEFIW